MKKIKNKDSYKTKKEFISDICYFCNAPCCKENFVPLTDKEVKSKKYDAVYESIFNLETKKITAGYYLRRKKDGSCIYLNKFDLCTIWRERPLACRVYVCEKLKKSWTIYIKVEIAIKNFWCISTHNHSR